MLTDHIKPGVKILGLSSLINSGRPGFQGCYRVVAVGTTMAIEFFDKAKRKDLTGMYNIGILPYRTSMIAELSLNEAEEVVSGEFTGCVMSLYKKGGVLTAAHVDTNKDTSKRGAYDSMKAQKAIEVIDEYDTAGKLKAPSTVIICVANKTGIKHYVVSIGTHHSHKTIPVPGEPGKFSSQQVGEPIYDVLLNVD